MEVELQAAHECSLQGVSFWAPVVLTAYKPHDFYMNKLHYIYIFEVYALFHCNRESKAGTGTL